MSNIIYQLKNKINGKIYIGKTTQSVMTRFHKHCHASLKDSNTLIHKAIRKYGKENFEVDNGLRIAQMVVCPVYQSDLQEVNDLVGTDRGEGGFGSTGTK